MCGIIGYIGNSEAAEILYKGLKRLEYRGYDSAGIATLSDNPGLKVLKDEGDIDELEENYNLDSLKGNIGVGHTRWATHGGVNQHNAHPHTDCSKNLAVVHNGIIENHKDIKKDLEDHVFTSDTDTEIIAHYFEEKLEEGLSMQEVMQQFMEDAEGTYAVVIMEKDTRRLYALKYKSPLAIGVGKSGYFFGSDLYAFSPHTDEAIFLEDGEMAKVSENELELFHPDKGEISRQPEKFEWEEHGKDKAEYDHYMHKEIHEQPDTIERLMKTFETSQKENMDKLAKKIEDSEKVIFTAAGTSYHAALLGVYYLQRAGVEAQALIASEFKNYERVDDNTLVIAVSQSGETMDVMEAIEYTRDLGGDVASIVNVPYSSIQRESDISLEIHAGQEVCVAATKTFTNQALTMLYLAGEMGLDLELEDIGRNVHKVIERNEPVIEELAEEMVDKGDMYVLGRGSTYPIAREIALKLKEIPYIHAEGMMGGELKHGTLALIEEGTPVLSLIPEKNDEILSNVEEVETRGARSVRISPHYGDLDIPINGAGFPIYSATIGFLLAYHIAHRKGLPVDKPRNLAKSVTVK